jgi:hypothetical protein
MEVQFICRCFFLQDDHILHPSLNIYHFDFFILTLTIDLIKKIEVRKKIKYILKLHYVINNIIVKIHNNYLFYFK